MSNHWPLPFETLFPYELWGRSIVSKGETSQWTPQIPINWNQIVEQKLQLTVWLSLYISGTGVEKCSISVDREWVKAPEGAVAERLQDLDVGSHQDPNTSICSFFG